MGMRVVEDADPYDGKLHVYFAGQICPALP
jgi:hypothetical protein